MSLGALVDTVDLTVCAVASLSVVLIFVEIGSPYTWFSWLLTSLLSAAFFPHSFVWAEYLLIFGLYPILKGYIERLPRGVWFLVKLVYFNGCMAALLWLVRGILGVDFFADTDFSLFENVKVFGSVPLMVAVFLVLANVTALAYDWFLAIMLRLYVFKFRDKFKRFLK